MASYQNKKNNIVKYKKRKSKWRIEHIIFLCILIYLIFNIIIVFNRTETSVYQVYEGSIINDTAYTGIAIREEFLYNSTAEGYIQYYYQDSSKVAAGSNIYTLSEDELVLESTNETSNNEEITLSTVEKNEIFSKIQSFNLLFEEENFSETGVLKQEIEYIIDNVQSESKFEYLNNLGSQTDSSVTIFTTSDDGIIIYQEDGYENFTENELSTDIFIKNNYQLDNFSSSDYINNGDTTYKLITSEEWIVYILLSDDDVDELADVTNLEVKFTKDNTSINCDFSIIQKSDGTYGKLEFDTGMVRYATERYLDIELIIDNQEGLKIPVTSVVEEEFYKVPNEYVESNGVKVQGADGSITFESASIYYTDEEYSYISTAKFEKGQVIVKSDSMETYTLSSTETLQGVYIINRGYAVFQYVNILTGSEEYYIVEYTTNGLDNYDNIALYGEGITEYDIIF